ncbi:hypothetical protein BH09ACT12_BH09ACT12_03610 [soil metagenome]
MLALGGSLGLVSGTVLMDDEIPVVVPWLLVASLLLEALACLALPVFLRRCDARFRARLDAATGDIASGRVATIPAIGRVVGRRTARRGGWYLPCGGFGFGPRDLTILAVLGDGAPRRVAAVVPSTLGLAVPRGSTAVLLHPDDREMAVVDDRSTSEQLELIEADPRWSLDVLPTDRSVLGGYQALLGSLLGGVVCGFAVIAVIASLALG